MNFLGDIRFGLRSLVKNPGFTAVAVAMLAIGIGVNAAVFTVTNAVLFKGFPLVKENDRLLYISPKGYNCCPSYPDFLDYRAQAKSFRRMAVVHGVGRIVRAIKPAFRKTSALDRSQRRYVQGDWPESHRRAGFYTRR